MPKPKGQRGSWFATWKGDSLPCVHRHWTKGIWPHHRDPLVNDDSKWPPFIAAIKKGRRVILTEDKPTSDGAPTGDRAGYVGVFEVTNVEVRGSELHFDFVKRVDNGFR